MTRRAQQQKASPRFQRSGTFASRRANERQARISRPSVRRKKPAKAGFAASLMKKAPKSLLALGGLAAAAVGAQKARSSRSKHDTSAPVTTPPVTTTPGTTPPTI